MERFEAVQSQLSGALSRLLVTVERYPELKTNQNFLALQTQLEGTENRIVVERRRFNEAVREYNTKLRRSRATSSRAWPDSSPARSSRRPPTRPRSRR